MEILDEKSLSVRLLEICKQLATEEARTELHNKAKELIRNKFDALSGDFQSGKEDLEILKEALRVLEPYKLAGRNDIYLVLGELIKCIEDDDLVMMRRVIRVLAIF